MALTVDVTWSDSSAMAAVAGEVDLVTAPVLARRIAEITGRDPSLVVLDLGGVTFLDCCGARAVSAALRSMASRCYVIIQGIRPAVRIVFAITGLAASWPQEVVVTRPGRPPHPVPPRRTVCVPEWPEPVQRPTVATMEAEAIRAVRDDCL